MKKNKNFDIITVLVGLVLGVLIGYLLGTKLGTSETDFSVLKEETLEYVYLLQIEKFDNPSGASKYQELLSSKNLDSTVVFDKVYYYVYGGISSSEEGLEPLKTKFYTLGYETLVKKELLSEKTNSILDDEKLYEFYSECISNLYKSLTNVPFTISEKYYIDPINIELFTQLTILVNMKNESLRQKAQLQAYKIIIENL